MFEKTPRISSGILMMALTKEVLTQKIHDELGFSKREARDFIDTFFEQVKASLTYGEGVRLQGFGSFRVRDKPARLGRNPKTKEPVTINPRRVVLFRPSRMLRESISHTYVCTIDKKTEALGQVISELCGESFDEQL